jgi:gliding motility-associated lipoprotein GldD
MLFTPNRLQNFVSIFVIFVLIIAMMASCQNDQRYPRPRGYLRIELPPHAFQSFDSTFPYQFEYSTAARLRFDEANQENPYWMNIDYPAYRASVYLSYKSLDHIPLYDLQKDAHEMVFKHAPKAVGIKESTIDMPDPNVYGRAYTIEGRDVASPFQFWVTDSTHSFLRGALYFNVTPNNDSLQPVIDYIVADIDHLVATLRWKR